MESMRGLLRDFVGILFPGGICVVITLWGLFGVSIIFMPIDFFPNLNNLATYSMLIIFSYTFGQFLRLKQLDYLEGRCTEEYRKKRVKEIKKKEASEISQSKLQAEFEQSIQKLDELEEKYSTGNLEIEQLKKEYIEHRDRFGFWEESPYPYLLKARRLVKKSIGYNKFFEKYDGQGVMKHRAFFNFCKDVIFEYSSSLKEEAVRQESLIRLFAGIYYAIRYGNIVNSIIVILHLILITIYHLKLVSFSYRYDYSYGIVLVSLTVLLIFLYLRKEVLCRLRNMRGKELEMVYNSFYILCKRHNLDF